MGHVRASARPASGVLLAAAIIALGAPPPAPAQSAAPCGAEPRSHVTACAEEDNVNIPLWAGRVSQVRLVATHPAYAFDVDSCAADFSGCGAPVPGTSPPSAPDVCDPLLDDGTTVVHVCRVADWWRPSAMTVLAGASVGHGHYLVLYRKIDGEAAWPQVLVLYQDGNLRLKPHPPVGRSDVCFGSSVIVGPAPPAPRPHVDIQEVVVTPEPLSLDLTYAGGVGTARVALAVDRTRAEAVVHPSYATGPAAPFATFRSMWVSDGNADVDRVQNPDGTFPILTDTPRLVGPWWLFHRMVPSRHNTSAPDIRIDVVDEFPQLLLSLDRHRLRPGDTFIATVTVVPGLQTPAVDAYLAIRLPDSRLAFLQADGSLSAAASPAAASWTPVHLRAELMRHTLTGDEPPGSYSWLGGLTAAGGTALLGCFTEAPFTIEP